MQTETKVLMDRCPVIVDGDGGGHPCDQPLQATIPVYFSETAVDLEVMDDGKLVVADIAAGVHAFGDEPEYEGQDGWKVYCADDHSLEQMLAAWQHGQDGDV